MPGPLLILVLSVGVIVAGILLFRLHAFFALMLAAIVVAALSAAGQHRPLAPAVEDAAAQFGAAAGKIGFAVALAAVIGVCLMESGSADKLVRRLLAAFGEKRAAAALLLSGLLLSAPVFSDTVAMLLLPIGRALAVRTGKDYLLYVLAICAGCTISNATIPPAPGPLLAAEALGLNLGIAIVAGGIFGILPAFGSLAAARWFNARMPMKPRPLPGVPAELLAGEAARPESELPSLAAAVAPVLVPVVLIAGAAVLKIARLPLPGRLASAVDFLGDKNVALLLGAAIAVAVHVRQKRLGWRQAGTVLGPPLEIGGMIILIIAAGGAYGAMIQRSGLGDAVHGLAGRHAINFVLLAWFLAALLRVAQGSATVAMITSVGITFSIAGAGGFGVHPLYIYLAAGYGSKAFPWMNDAGFWVVSRIGNLTQGEVLRSWSLLSTALCAAGLIEVLVVSHLWPHLPF